MTVESSRILKAFSLVAKVRKAKKYRLPPKPLTKPASTVPPPDFISILTRIQN